MNDISTLIGLARNSCLPWNSVDAESEYRIFGGSIARLTVYPQEEIDKCLSCTLPECVNCISGGKRQSVGRPKKNTQ